MEFKHCSCMYHGVPLTWFLENMRLLWQQKLFEGRNLGSVFGSFEVLGVLIGKDRSSTCRLWVLVHVPLLCYASVSSFIKWA